MPPKPKLTKEEKKAKKEAKRLEKLRLELEAKRQARRDELSREMAMQAARRGELDKSWREIMFRIKEPVFKQEIEIMWHTFERAYDKKDHLIKHLMKLIDTADDQYQRTISGFCDMIDNMINKFLIDLENLSKENDIRTAALLKWGGTLRDKLKKDTDSAETHLQLLIFQGHKSADDYIWEKRGENMVKEDEERSNFLDMRDNLRSFLENLYNNMWDEYKAVLRNYVQGTAENQKNVRRLRRKENIMADIIASQGKKIANSDKTLEKLRKELAVYESGSKMAAFRDRRDRHRAAAEKLKRRLVNGMRIDENRLAILVKASGDATQALEDCQKKGMKIIRLAALCRRYETQREKVLPFGSEMPHDSSLHPHDSKTNLRRQQSDDSLLNLTMATCSGLAKLWHRVSKAELAKRALLREKMILERENEMLIERLEDIDTDSIPELFDDEDPYRCICGDNKIDNPVAIDGTMVVQNYKKYYS